MIAHMTVMVAHIHLYSSTLSLSLYRLITTLSYDPTNNNNALFRPVT